MRLSRLFTAFFAYSPHRTMEFILDGEMAVGGGLSVLLLNVLYRVGVKGEEAAIEELDLPIEGTMVV